MAPLMIRVGKPQVRGAALQWLRVAILDVGSISQAQILLDSLLGSSKVEYASEEKDQGRHEPHAGCEVSRKTHHRFLCFTVLS